MHDPLVVAFHIRRPWPRRTTSHMRVPPRWQFRGVFWYVAGRCWYWPELVTVWHREPKGHDAGTICPHFRRWQDDDGEWHTKVLRGWRFHLHHWYVQVPPLQTFRRWALTRCAWCGGPSRKGDPVNVSHQWDGPRGPWWHGELGLLHADCSSVRSAHQLCLCEAPILDHDDYGRCLLCSKYRPWRDGPRPSEPRPAERRLAALPIGSRIPENLRPELERLWAAARTEAR